MDNIVELMQLSPIKRQIYDRMVEYYQQNLPDSLYLNFYELSEKTGIESDLWEEFLDIKEIEHWVTDKMTRHMEMSARSALFKLSKMNATANEVAAIKELLSKSKLLSQAQNIRPTVILTYIPRTIRTTP